jgi:catechol 2,3-dioxygenase-like lactoylglutathione lyase family enzyme
VFERFTDRARHVLVLAQEEARHLNHDFLGTEHILLGLISEGHGVAAQALEQLDITLEAARERVEETIGTSGPTTTGSPPFTPRAKKVLELSYRESLQLGHKYIGTEHLLLGLAREGEGVAAHVLVGLGAELSRVRLTVIDLLNSPPGDEATRRDPLSGIEVTQILVVSDTKRSRAFWADVLGADVYREYDASVVLRFGSSWVLLVSEGEPTPDKPTVTFTSPSDPHRVSHAMTVRVRDCQAAYEKLLERGAEFLTPPYDWGGEVRCFLRDPDGHLIELSEAK